ncbi:hypothetical protein [Flammeovirga sp. SJP92]|uniref:hypothetical protein n=1 Tax=Flammeovirga sp. SJP92 TaxID=1775430 RepID=UPI000787ADD8|nr:hypothetical protein [Flammeovirga sp. SJP92]KXX66887.1 hypothetical protein AVL50_30625 [Flammeovirga sp. SJP92]
MKTRFTLFSLILPFLFYNCTYNVNKKEEIDSIQVEIIETSSTQSPIIIPDDILNGYIPPYDLQKNAGVLESALFAWKEMIALSWQSNYTETNTWRGKPDTTWTYAQGTPQKPLVWETFAHRIEYRPKGDQIVKSFNSKPSYSFVNDDKIDWNGIDQSKQFVVLDEDSEIASCYVFAKPNIEKVTPKDKLVMYMAKVNEVEYNYRKDYFNSHESIVASLSTISDPDGGTDSLKKISTYNGGLFDPCGSKHFGEEGIIVFPCSDEPTKQRGVIEIKTAWRPLTVADNKEEFLVRDAIVFDENQSSQFVAKKEKYVLIGMHIIQKTNNYRNFFIASWEHNSLQNYGYKFVVNNPPSPAPGQDYQILAVERHNDEDGAHSYIEEVYYAISDSIQARIKKANPTNFLANYRLIGFQSNLYPEATLEERKVEMPAYYLANLIIESDSVLADFTGSTINTPFNNDSNVVVNGKLITAGGCSGCHGAAQQKGVDFSFVTDTLGKPIPEPDPRSLSQEKIDAILYDMVK